MEERTTVNFKKEEFAIREYIKKDLGKGKVSKVRIEYTPVGEKIIVSTNKPGLVIGKKGEIPHRRNQDFTIMSGRFPKNASENFIKILRSLGGNAVANGLDNPVIVEAIANMADRPHGKFGRTRKKRSHVTIKVKDKIIKFKEKKK